MHARYFEWIAESKFHFQYLLVINVMKRPKMGRALRARKFLTTFVQKKLPQFESREGPHQKTGKQITRNEKTSQKSMKFIEIPQMFNKNFTQEVPSRNLPGKFLTKDREVPQKNSTLKKELPASSARHQVKLFGELKKSPNFPKTTPLKFLPKSSEFPSSQPPSQLGPQP